MPFFLSLSIYLSIHLCPYRDRNTPSSGIYRDNDTLEFDSKPGLNRPPDTLSSFLSPSQRDWENTFSAVVCHALIACIIVQTFDFSTNLEGEDPFLFFLSFFLPFLKGVGYWIFSNKGDWTLVFLPGHRVFPRAIVNATFLETVVETAWFLTEIHGSLDGGIFFFFFWKERMMDFGIENSWEGEF